MTLFSFSISTVGIWLELLDTQLGLQFRHSNYEAPYIYIQVWRFRTTITLGSITIQWGDRAVPRIYTTVWWKNWREVEDGKRRM